MARESLRIEIGGAEPAGLYDDLVLLEVELSDEQPATFRLEVGIPREADGAWRHLDDDPYRVWSEVTIEGGFEESGREELLTGYVTEVRAAFAGDPARSVLVVSGTDKSVVMDRDEKLKDWPGKKDSDIATEIFSVYGFTPRVDDTAVVHDEALATIIQRETDLSFLRRLALRNGFACYVEGDRAFFGKVPAAAAPQPVLATHFGGETSLRRFAVTVDALRPANVAMFQVDRFEKETLAAAVEASEIAPQGKLDAQALLPGGLEPARVYVGKNAATGAPEMEALCRGLFHEGAWFVEGEGEVDAAAYGHVLKPRGTVTVKGVGETYSGVYYVSYVRHTFTRRGYSQTFRARRNALEPTGAESFASAGGGLF